MADDQTPQGYDDSVFETSGQNFQQRDQSTIRWMEDMKEELMALNNWLEGKTVSLTTDGDYSWEKQPDSKAKMNTSGRSTLVSGLTFLVNKNLAMGNISKEQATRSALDMADNFVLHFGINFKKYDLDPSDFQNLCAHYRNFIILAFSRPIGAGERSGILHQIAESIHSVFGSTQQQSEDKKGFGKWIGR
jgi:hypothetical protein